MPIIHTLFLDRHHQRLYMLLDYDLTMSAIEHFLAIEWQKMEFRAILEPRAEHITLCMNSISKHVRDRDVRHLQYLSMSEDVMKATLSALNVDPAGLGVFAAVFPSHDLVAPSSDKGIW